MATPTARVRGGYEYKFVEEPPHGLKCVICLAVARQPQQHGECGALFCMSCLTQHRQTTSQCPNCSLELATFYDGKSEQEVKALQIKCVNGCQWVGTLESIDNHLWECECALIPCPNNCFLNQKTVHVCRRDLENHLANDCLKRPYTCPHCGEPGLFTERTTVHLESCPKVEVQCPLFECNQTVPRSELELHLSECEYDVASCKFAKFGCRVRQAKKHLKVHEEDDHLHLQSTKEKVLELCGQVEEQERIFLSQIEQQNAEIRAIKSSIRSCKKNTAPITFRFLKFTQHKYEDKYLLSPAFYSNQGGYHFVIAVHANGNGTGKGTHISLFVYILKGERDDSLTWPFRGSVTVELINQLGKENHRKFVIRFPDDEEVSGRMVGGERSSGWGKPRLIPHSQLEYNPRAKTQFLKNDTLYFHVSVQDPNYKPWLECTI